jgi:hypothetical protein
MPVYESACRDSITGIAGLSEIFERFAIREFEECMPEVGEWDIANA